MRIATILLLCLTLSAALAAPDSLACRMVDWMDAPGNTMRYGSTGTGEYAYSGTCLWDMAMGDSFLVWLPGTDWFFFINPFSQSEVETLAGFDYGSVGAKGVTVKDSISYIVGGGGVNTTQYRNDSLLVIGGLWIPGASFHYATIRDTFLYTASTGSYGLHCINIADPEEIFVAWTAPYFFGTCGIAVIDSFSYAGGFGCDFVHPPDDSPRRPYRNMHIVKSLSDTAGVGEAWLQIDNIGLGDLAADDENLFHLYTDMTDWSWDSDYNLGATHLDIWETDNSYTWAEPYGEASFGVDVLNERILAVGFEHGFSIIDYSDLEDLQEVAYYRNTDSIFCFTHFALKEDRLFAMAHPRAETCRMYMFELDSTIWTGISDPTGNKGLQPLAFEISSWPNPFNSAVTISIEGVGDGSPVPFSVEIYDVNGRRVAEIIPPDPPLTRGEEERKSPLSKGDLGGLFVWRPAPSLPSGIYLVRATIPGNKVLQPLVSTKRIVYLK